MRGSQIASIVETYNFIEELGWKGKFKEWTEIFFIINAFLLGGPGQFFSFLILYTVGRTAWKGGQPITRPLPTYRTTQTE
jgi:hypothetical protein